jgi:hypothetical protein
MKCPNCQETSLDKDDIFCSNCGADIIASQKINNYKNVLKNSKTQYQVQNNSNLKLNRETIDLYQNLSRQILDLQNIPQKLSMNKEQLSYLQHKLIQKKNHFSALNLQLNKEKKDVEKLKKLSVTSMIAKIKGDTEKKIQKEETEYFDLLNKIEGLKNEINIQTNEENILRQHVFDLENLNLILEQNKAELIKIIHQVTKGVPDPIEDALERELETLISLYSPLESSIERLSRGLSYINSAISELNVAFSRLEGASNYADWDTFFGGGMFVDSMKHSRMSEARDAVARARHFIELARHVEPNVGNISVFVEDLNFFWDSFMDNIFSDLSARGKINRSRDSVQNALFQLNDIKNRLEFNFTSKNNELRELDQKMNFTRQKLLIERKRMIEEAIITNE